MEAALRTQLHEGVAKGLKAARRWGWGLEHLGRGGRKWKPLEQKLGVVVTLSSTGNVI